MAWSCGTPKYDLHRHFGGCISTATITKLLGDRYTPDEVTQLMVCDPSERNFTAFLNKFEILNEVHWTEDAIVESIKQVVRDQAHEQIDYSEISFSIDKYLDHSEKWTRPELIRFISDVFNDACSAHNTKVELILSLRMEATRSRQLINAALVNRTDVIERLAGIDIVGNERYFDTRFYKPIFNNWRNAGKVTLAHVGETCGADNVFDAITQLHVHRIRHGIAAANDVEVLAAARDDGVCFDISIHSNLLVGTIASPNKHHLPKLLQNNCNVTLGTDDPVTFNCTLDDEYMLASKHGLLGIDEESISRNTQLLRNNAIKFAKISMC